MSKATDWEFMLNGDVQELRELSQQPGSMFFNIYGGVDFWNDCPNHDFRMNTLYCEGEEDPHMVWQIGYELLGLFNGASVLFDKDYRKASIHKVLYNNSEVRYVEKENMAALLGNPSVPQEVIDREEQECRSSNTKFKLVRLAACNEDVYFFLKYLDMNIDWTTLYKLKEAVESFAKHKNIELSTNKDLRSAFHNTANNFSLSGFDSRHGFKMKVKDNNSDHMTISDGYRFVTNMVKKYLSEAYPGL
ncbi:hypothetical protein QD172_00900 [Cobetia sp. 10Alg 146]|uniref:hypothetical protein n=1 Tax=Cobetia sp. 10Alg 146 TaxID=3040019 RepID=UPI0024490142|nr:hypothetical protein [Cobetia sp. 10Alg 146]MDH2289808.1 hypothetical protein [Cobetia sp. 10Alg 146]